jgi:ribonuclease HI
VFVGFSYFILEQTARHRCFTTTTVHTTPPVIVPPTQSSLNHRLIDIFITSSYHIPILKQLSISLSNTLSPIYYTDGSVDTSQTTVGTAWIETSRNTHLSFHMNLPHDWMISFKSELIAIILSLFITRETSHVTIYTDSKSVINKFNALNSEVNRFSSSHHNTKLQYFKYWTLLFHLIEILQLKV